MKRVEKRQVDNCLQSQVIHKMRTLVELQKFKMKTGTKRRAPPPPHEVSLFRKYCRAQQPWQSDQPLDKALHIVSKEQMITLGFSNCFRALPGGSPCEKTNWRIGGRHTSNLSREPREYPCKFFLAGVNFYRFNAKNWQFTV